MPRTTNRGINPHTHDLDDIVGIETVGGVESFTFAPNTESVGFSFGTWPELYAAYLASVTLVPNKNRQIVFDPRGLPPGTPITIPQISGVAVQTFESSTTFSSAGNPINQIDVEVDPGVRWQISPDPSAPTRAVLAMRGLNFVVKAGDSGSLLTVPALTSLLAKLENGGIRTKSPPPMVAVADGDLDIRLVDCDVASESGGGRVFQMDAPLPATRDLFLESRGSSALGRNTIGSAAQVRDLTSVVSSGTRPSAQSGLRPPDGTAVFAPSATENKRPAQNLTVLVRSQLHLIGANSTPQVLQAFAFRMSGGVPVAGNTFSITNGILVETWTFVALRVNPFEVTIGGTAGATMMNLIAAINLDSPTWKSEAVTLPGGGGRAVAIVRRAQLAEGNTFGYDDRAYGTIAAAANPFVADYPGADDLVTLSYSEPTFSPLPSSDGGRSFAGWSSVSLITDKSFVTVIDDDTSGIYQALNPFPGGSGTWKYVADGIDPTLVIGPGGGAFSADRQTRFVRATLAAVDVTTLALPPTFQPGEILSVFRTDATAGVFSLVPTAPDMTVNGVAAPYVVAPLAGGHGLMLQRDGAGGWWIVGQFP